jgi:hypothetical protein
VSRQKHLRGTKLSVFRQWRDLPASYRAAGCGPQVFLLAAFAANLNRLNAPVRVPCQFLQHRTETHTQRGIRGLSLKLSSALSTQSGDNLRTELVNRVFAATRKAQSGQCNADNLPQHSAETGKSSILQSNQRLRQ